MEEFLRKKIRSFLNDDISDEIKQELKNLLDDDPDNEGPSIFELFKRTIIAILFLIVLYLIAMKIFGS